MFRDSVLYVFIYILKCLKSSVKIRQGKFCEDYHLKGNVTDGYVGLETTSWIMILLFLMKKNRLQQSRLENSVHHFIVKFLLYTHTYVI